MSSPPSPSPLSRLILDLRGQRFHLERDTLMTLPESVLLCLFPNGLVLSRQQGRYESDDEGEGAEAEDEEDVYLVDVSCSGCSVRTRRTRMGSSDGGAGAGSRQMVAEARCASIRVQTVHAGCRLCADVGAVVGRLG
jgi:hypothetical protein